MGGATSGIAGAVRQVAEAAEKESDQFEQPADSPTAGGGTDPTGGGKGSSQQEQPVGPREESFRNPWAQSRPQFRGNRAPNANMFGQGRFSGGNRNAQQAMRGQGRQNPGGGFQPPPPMQAANPQAPPPYTPPPQQPSGGKGASTPAPAPAPAAPSSNEWQPQRNADGSITAGQHRVAGSANTARLARKYGTNSTKGSRR